MVTGRVPEPPYDPPGADRFGIIHADDCLIAVNKPAGLLAVPGRGPAKVVSALSYAQARLGEVHVVHRLDMDTSGIMLFARSTEMARQLGMAFEQRSMMKTYQALVEGIVSQEQGEISLPIGRNWDERPLRRIDHAAGKPACTHWRVVARQPDVTLLSLQPETGRTHQLRLHLSAIGHAILGDRLYGRVDSAARLMLHASELAFEHPKTGQAVHLSCAPDFA